MREWKTLRRVLSSHSLVSTTLPLNDGTIIQVRKPSVPDPEQAQISSNSASTGNKHAQS